MPGLTVESSPCPSAGQLKVLWNDLEQRSGGSVFLSWAWIGTLVETSSRPLTLLSVREGVRLVGLAVLGESAGHGPFSRLTHHLNQSGDPALDGVTIEYNGLLAERGLEAAVAEVFVSALCGTNSEPLSPPVRRLVLAGVEESLGRLCAEHGLQTRLIKQPQGAPYADLTALPADDLLKGFSANTRQQIRRSLRFYAQRGPLVLERASSVDEAWSWFHGLEAFHTEAWRRRAKNGAFGSPAFARFHRRILADHFDHGPDVLRVRAGRGAIAYLYNFVWRGEVYAYQSGFAYEPHTDARPGLVAHALAMGHYREQGLSRYRFLAGDARYKQSLSTGRDELHWLEVSRPSLLSGVEHLLRLGYGRLFGGRLREADGHHSQKG